MLIITGLFRKCVIADNCALLANAVFNGSFGHPTLPLVLLGVYAFAWQIYGDFSGYSDIARGSAQLLGFHFMVNFRQPYLATSLPDIWHRWHISLSTWLRDYLYIPLGGSRHGERKTYRNLFATMLLGGFWHGANWTYVIWGAIHGTGLALQRWVGRKGASSEGTPSDAAVRAGSRSPLAVWTTRIVVFHFICFTWIFFRANSVGDGLRLLGGLTHLAWSPDYFTAFKFLVLFSLPLFLLDLRMDTRGEEYPFEKTAHSRGGCGLTETAIPQRETASCGRRILFAACTLVLIALFGASQPNAFIYFQF